MRRSPLVILQNGDVGEIQTGDSLLNDETWQEHFLGNALDNRFATTLNTGTVTVNSQAIAGTFGNVVISSGATLTTGSAILHSGQNQTVIGGNFYVGFGCRFYLPTQSTGTNRFTTRIGLSGAVATIGDQTGIYFRYNDSVAGGAIQGVCRNGATETVVNSSTIVNANTIYDLYFLVNSTGTSVEFFINNVSIGTISTNLPSTATLLGIFASIQKSIGLTARTLNIDSWFFEVLK